MNAEIQQPSFMQQRAQQRTSQTTEYVRPKRTTLRQQPSGQSMQSRAFATTNTMKRSLDYGVGDRVAHIKFGNGTVTGIIEGGRDFEVTVDFDTVGTKKMFASFAKLKKL